PTLLHQPLSWVLPAERTIRHDRFLHRHWPHGASERATAQPGAKRRARIDATMPLRLTIAALRVRGRDLHALKYNLVPLCLERACCGHDRTIKHGLGRWQITRP